MVTYLNFVEYCKLLAYYFRELIETNYQKVEVNIILNVELV